MKCMPHENAFPVGNDKGECLDWAYGLTKREAFAMAAMQSIAGHYVTGRDSLAGHIATMSVEIADALIAELSKQS